MSDSPVLYAVLAAIACCFSGCGSNDATRPRQVLIPVEASSLMMARHAFLEAGSISMLAVGDIDGDSITDIVVGYPRGIGDFYPQCQVAAYSGGSGNQIWRVISRADQQPEDIPDFVASLWPCADLSADGVPDIYAASETGTVYLLSGKDGEVISKTQIDDGIRGHTARPLTVVDVDGDARPELVYGVNRSRQFMVKVFDIGNTTASMQIDRLFPDMQGERTWVLADFADENQDGVRDHLARLGLPQSFDDEVYEFEMAVVSGVNFQVLRRFRTPRPRTGSSDEAYVNLGDLTGDGVPEIAMAGGAGASDDRKLSHLRVFSGSDGNIIWEVNGSQVAGRSLRRVGKDVDESYTDCSFGRSLAAIEDCNGDSAPDVAAVVDMRIDKRTQKRLVVFSGVNGEVLQVVNPAPGVRFQRASLVPLERANRDGDPGVAIVSIQEGDKNLSISVVPVTQ